MARIRKGDYLRSLEPVQTDHEYGRTRTGDIYSVRNIDLSIVDGFGSFNVYHLRSLITRPEGNKFFPVFSDDTRRFEKVSREEALLWIKKEKSKLSNKLERKIYRFL